MAIETTSPTICSITSKIGLGRDLDKESISGKRVPPDGSSAAAVFHIPKIVPFITSFSLARPLGNDVLDLLILPIV